MNLRKNIGILAGILVLGMSIPTIAVTATNSEGVNVCVDWDTKQVRFSKYWEKCPAKHTQLTLGARGEAGPQGEIGPQGPAGPAGADGARGPRGASGESEGNSYPWGNESSCYQQLQAALTSGYKMAYKTDRQTFEGDTGCIVEQIRDEELDQQYVAVGFPVITDWQLVGTPQVSEGEGYCPIMDFCLYQSGGFATYSIKIDNADALSYMGNEVGYCAVFNDGYNAEYLVSLGDGRYLADFRFRLTENEATVTMELGFKRFHNTRCESLHYLRPPIVIHEDPSVFDEGFDNQLIWGWQTFGSD